jgi:hypothetical protein
MLTMRQGALWIVPHIGHDLGQVPLRFRQRPLIVIGLCHASGILQERSHPGLIVRLLHCQDRQAVQGHAGQHGLTLALCIGEQLFIGVPGLLPGVLEGIGLPQVDIEAFDLWCRQYGQKPLVLLQRGACLFIVSDGVCDGEDGHRLHPGLHAIAIGCLDLPRSPRMVRQFGSPRSLTLEPCQGALVQDLPPCRAKLGVDYIAHQVMGEAIAAQTAHPCILLAQDPIPDRLLQGLDGLPLAIELAVARLKVLPLLSLLERLEHRMAILTGGPRDMPARQHTLRNTIAWSYELLSAEEQGVFRLLSIFVGGCTLEALEQVYGALTGKRVPILDGVASLLDKHLLSRAEQDMHAPRLLMLETLREYGLEALEALGELEAARLAYARYFLALAEEADAHQFDQEQQEWFDQLEREQDNLRAALRWSVEQEQDSQQREVAWRLIAALQWFWVVYGYVREGGAVWRASP